MDEKLNILMVDDELGKILSYEAILGVLGENLIRAHSGARGAGPSAENRNCDYSDGRADARAGWF